MLKPDSSPSLVIRLNGRETSVPLEPGTNLVGRDTAAGVKIAHPSVSRRHAEIEVGPTGTVIRDLESRNGLRVNGVPRKQALLHNGDTVRFGSVESIFQTGFARVPANSTAKVDIDTRARLEQTRRSQLRLPEQRQERHLTALYHLCFWLTDGFEKPGATERFLELLLEALRAGIIQIYAPDGRLEHSASETSPKRRVKFASYLLEKFQALPEAAAFTPKELGKFQPRFGDYHVLVAPLRPSGTSDGTCSIAAVLRPAEWEPFSAEDRVLFQAACQLWIRGETKAREVRALRMENAQLKERAGEPELLGAGASMRKLRIRLEKIGATKVTVLITGETGAGKEVVAQHLHRHSPRAGEPFVKVNCAAIPATLMESELFGHVKGAFTDARADHKGKFLLAHGGTLFLDEIGELPLPVQSKLLRALESGEIERLGSESPVRVDVRILAATNRELKQLAADGGFREDLLYRLQVVTVHVPPLRDHLDDLEILARRFLDAFCDENGLAALELAPDALTALKKHPWPGNVRELRNVIQRLAIEAEGPAIRAADVRDVLNA